MPRLKPSTIDKIMARILVHENELHCRREDIIALTEDLNKFRGHLAESSREHSEIADDLDRTAALIDNHRLEISRLTDLTPQINAQVDADVRAQEARDQKFIDAFRGGDFDAMIRAVEEGADLRDPMTRDATAITIYNSKVLGQEELAAFFNQLLTTQDMRDMAKEAAEESADSNSASAAAGGLGDTHLVGEATATSVGLSHPGDSPDLS